MARSWRARIEGLAEQHKALPKPWTLLKQALRDYRHHKKLLVSIVLVVTLPVALLSTYAASASDSTLSSWLAIAQIAMDVALIYGIIELVHRRGVSVRQAYYRGSAMLVRFVLVLILVVLMAFFLFAGLAILAFGVVAPGTALTLGEQVLLIILAIAIAIPSVVLLTRGIWALYIVFEYDNGPLQAVSASRRITKGKVIVTLGRLLALIGFLLALLIVPVIIFVLLQNVTHLSLFSLLLQVFATLLILPVANLYLYRYYQALQ